MKKISLFLFTMIFYCFILSGCSTVENTNSNPEIADSANANQNQDQSVQTPKIELPNQIYFMHKDNSSSITAFKVDGSTLVDVDENGYFMYEDQKYRAFYNEDGRLTWDQTYNSGLPMCIMSYEGTAIPVELYNGDERLGIYEQNGKRYFLYNIPHSDIFEGYEITPGTESCDYVIFNRAGLMMEDGVIVVDVKEYETIKFEIAKQLEQIYFDGIKVTDLSMSRLREKYANARIVEDLSEFLSEFTIDEVILPLNKKICFHPIYMDDAVDCSTFNVILSVDEKHIELLEITGVDNGVYEYNIGGVSEVLYVSQVNIDYNYIDIIEVSYDEYFDNYEDEDLYFGSYGGRSGADDYYSALKKVYSDDEIKDVDEAFYNSYVLYVIYEEPFYIWSYGNSYQLKYVYVQLNESTPEYRTVDIILDGSKDSLIQIPNSWMEPAKVEMDGKHYHHEISLDRETLINPDGMTHINIAYVDPLRKFFMYYIRYRFDYEWLPEDFSFDDVESSGSVETVVTPIQ